MLKKYTIFLTLLLCFFLPRQAHAVLPPDLIFNVGSQIVQIVSVVALIIGAILSSLVLLFRRWLSLTYQHVWYVIAFIVIVVVMCVAVVCIAGKDKQQSSPPTVEDLDESKVATNSSLAINKHFISDTVTLYSNDFDEPFSLELNVNRKEDVSGTFLQYSFLNVNWAGDYFEDYDVVQIGTSTPQGHGFLESFYRQQSPDLLTRDVYKSTVLVRNKLLSFSVDNLEGDFITKDDPAFTRYQSVGMADVMYDGLSFKAYVLVEGTHSDDYNKYLFPSEKKELEVSSQQFILWDQEGSFYMIDKSEVYTDNPSYKSHNWVLYKNGLSHSLQKSFESNIIPITNTDGQKGWTVTIPNVSNTEINVFTTETYTSSSDQYLKMLVSGTVKDENGLRKIGGILYVVQ